MKKIILTWLTLMTLIMVSLSFVMKPDKPPLKLNGVIYKYCCTKYITDTLNSGYGTVIIVTTKRVTYDAINCKDVGCEHYESINGF